MIKDRPSAVLRMHDPAAELLLGGVDVGAIALGVDVGGEAPQHAEGALEVGTLFSIPHPLQHHQAAGAHDVQHTVSVADLERP